MTHHAAGGAAPGGIRQDCRPGVLPDAAPGITTTTTRTPEVPSMTDTHDDPSRYGCDPRHYLPPDIPEGWAHVTTFSPDEPAGWQGAARVVLAYRHDGTSGSEWVTWVCLPSGVCMSGSYRLDPVDAAMDYSTRCEVEARRAARWQPREVQA